MLNLAELCIYSVDVASVCSTEGKSISFKLDSSRNDGEAYVSASDGGITVSAASVYGLKTAADRLLDIICPEGSTGSLSPKLSGELFVAYSEPTVSLSFLCLSGILPIDASSEITDVTWAVSDNSPHGVFLGELGDSDKARIQSALPDYGDVSAESGSAVLALTHLSSELIYRESSGGLLREGYRLKGNGLDLILLYVSGSADADTDIELPQELVSVGLPVVAVLHNYNGEEVRAVCEGNGNFSKVYSDSVAHYGDIFSYACYADTGCLSVSLSAADNSCGYRQISIKAIS